MPDAKTPAILALGVASHVGKSVVVAGLCRALARAGVRVAPFKAVNMSLNSAATPEGREIGRAQAMQAEAAGCEAHADMNPVLLKPESADGCQIVLAGRRWRSVKAGDMPANADALHAEIRESYARLAGRFEAIVAEGSGAAMEPNLRKNDLANLGLAQMLDLPAFLIGDIDRGGVFAALYGTWALMDEDDRRRLKGFVVNKFRGDAAQLESAVRDLENRTGMPCLGVVPWIENLAVDEEDGVALEAERAAGGTPEIAVVRLPHISNFTDIEPLRRAAGAAVGYVAEPKGLEKAKLIVIPGSKNTVADLRWLKANGLAEKIAERSRSGAAVVGICGGFQMMGAVVEDPEKIEGAGGSETGIGLIDAKTVLTSGKCTENVCFTWAGDGVESERFRGYEIHVGRTERQNSAAPAFAISQRGEATCGAEDGVIDQERKILGTYIHGLFDNAAVRRRILEWAGISEKSAQKDEDYLRRRDMEYDRLADRLEESLNMTAIHEIMGLGAPKRAGGKELAKK